MKLQLKQTLKCFLFLSLQVLHLLGFAIQEEISEHYPFLSFYERSQKYYVLEKLEELARCPRVSIRLQQIS